MPLLPYLILAGALSAAPQVGDTQEAAPPVQPPVADSTAPSSARLAAGQPIPPAELETLIDALVRQTMSISHIAGASVAIVQDDRVVLEKGYGWADLGVPGLLLDDAASLQRARELHLPDASAARDRHAR